MAADGTCTNTIEGTWRHLKRSLPMSVRQDKYHGYLGEFLWRRRHRGEDLFAAFIADIANLRCPSANE